MKLFNYYTLDECKDRKKILKKLDELKDDGKVEYEMDGRDLFYLKDLDLEEIDIDGLNKLFDSEDVFPYLENEDEESEGDGFNDYEENDY
jgi:hypothetical protein